MPKQKLEIEVEVPEGYETTGEFRLPKKGEYFLNSCGDLHLSTHDWTNNNYSNFYENRIILHKKYEWPIWLKARYISKNDAENWLMHDKLPVKHQHCYWSPCMDLINPKFLNFTPPECSDWTKSLMENPNWQS